MLACVLGWAAPPERACNWRLRTSRIQPRVGLVVLVGGILHAVAGIATAQERAPAAVAVATDVRARELPRL